MFPLNKTRVAGIGDQTEVRLLYLLGRPDGIRILKSGSVSYVVWNRKNITPFRILMG